MTGRSLESRLEGTWSLVSWTVTYADGRPPTHPYGLSPLGLISYTSDGYVQVNIASRGHARSAVRAGTDAGTSGDAGASGDAGDAADGCFSYAGPFVVRGRSVVHQLQVSSDPMMTGTDQIREVELADDSLVLSVDTPVRSGITRTHRLEWSRIHGAVTYRSRRGH